MPSRDAAFPKVDEDRREFGARKFEGKAYQLALLQLLQAFVCFVFKWYYHEGLLRDYLK